MIDRPVDNARRAACAAVGSSLITSQGAPNRSICALASSGLADERTPCRARLRRIPTAEGSTSKQVSKCTEAGRSALPALGCVLQTWPMQRDNHAVSRRCMWESRRSSPALY